MHFDMHTSLFSLLRAYMININKTYEPIDRDKIISGQRSYFAKSVLWNIYDRNMIRIVIVCKQHVVL